MKRILDIFLQFGFDEKEALALVNSFNKILLNPFEKTNLTERLHSYFGIFKALGVSENSIRNSILIHPLILKNRPERIQQNLFYMSRLFGVDRAKMASIVLKSPNLLVRDPKSVERHLVELKKTFGFSDKKIVLMLSTATRVFMHNVEYIQARIQRHAKVLGVPVSSVTKMFVEEPAQLFLKPENVLDKVENLSALLGVKPYDLALKMVSFPRLLGIHSNTFVDKVSYYINHSGLKKEDVVKTCFSQVRLLGCEPSEVIAKRREIAQILNVSESGVPLTMGLVTPQRVKKYLHIYSRLYEQGFISFTEDERAGKKDIQHLKNAMAKNVEYSSRSLASLRIRLAFARLRLMQGKPLHGVILSTDKRMKEMLKKVQSPKFWAHHRVVHQMLFRGKERA